MLGVLTHLSAPEGAVVAAVITALLGTVFGAIITSRKNETIARLGAEKDKAIAQLKVVQELQIEYDKDLRIRRIHHYEKLWALMEPMAKYPPPDPITYGEVRNRSILFRGWYFAGGGLFLSEETRDSYFDLQDGCKIFLQKRAGSWPRELKEPLDPERLRRHLQRPDHWKPPPALLKIAGTDLRNLHGTPPDAGDQLPEELFEQLRELGSSLRTSMTKDVLTRTKGFLTETEN
jgi:hypothetical protein